MAFESLQTDRSAPSSSGRWARGVASVESTASSAPARRAARASASMSSTSRPGLVGDSAQTSRAPSAASSIVVWSVGTRRISTSRDARCSVLSVRTAP